MAPGGVEPPHTDSKSVALPLSYGAVLNEFARPDLVFLARRWRCGAGRHSATGTGLESAVPSAARGGRWRPAPPAAGDRRPGTRGVADGTRTRDHRDHNPGLYQLSYRHREGDRIAR